MEETALPPISEQEYWKRVEGYWKNARAMRAEERADQRRDNPRPREPHIIVGDEYVETWE